MQIASTRRTQLFFTVSRSVAYSHLEAEILIYARIPLNMEGWNWHTVSPSTTVYWPKQVINNVS